MSTTQSGSFTWSERVLSDYFVQILLDQHKKQAQLEMRARMRIPFALGFGLGFVAGIGFVLATYVQ